ncbi:hypothetical protein G4B88_019027 [Cannabis sativa]|uniref:Heme O synthase n=1 Tax=Cannabis sativa TaxID=3483 RepID=A0A7J6H280_CANSA|nr:hypothetical protein G4B88_019027 [Cannabis sativa]
MGWNKKESGDEEMRLIDGLHPSHGVGVGAQSALIDFSSKAREVADSARHYGRCYWELSKARLSNVGTSSNVSMSLDVHYLIHMLQSCNSHHFIHQGKQLHLVFLKIGLLESSVTIVNRLLQMYVRCGSMRDAHILFQEMTHRNCFSWNTMIEGYMKSGDCTMSLELFKTMPERNEFSWNVVIMGFTKAGWIDTARSLFDEMPNKNSVAWTSMIHGFAQNGQKKDALRFFKHLSSNPLEVSYRDKFVLATVIGVCTELAALGCGKQIHARIVIDNVEVDSVLSSSLTNFYGKCGDLDSANNLLNMNKEPDEYSLSSLIMSYANIGRMSDARRIFDVKNYPSIALWNSMISGYVCSNEYLRALTIFNEMRANEVRGDFLTLVSVLGVCSILGNLVHTKQFHIYACKVGMLDDVIVSGSLLDAYSKCGSLDDACKLFTELKAFDTILLNCMITVYSNCGRIKEAKQIFETMPIRSLISWNSMLAGLCQNGCPVEALNLLHEMNKLDLKMDKFTLASAISACACISSLEFGEQIFTRAIIIGLEYDEIISNSLLDLYCKCGLLENGRKIFDQITKCDEVPWNSMLMGYASNGHGLEAIELFNKMLQVGLRPNGITFTGVLSACDHCGLIEEGRRWFNMMQQDYHIAPSIEHYACMIDLFSREGLFDEAMNTIEHMPFKADISMLSSILRGCLVTGNKTLGKKVAERIVELDPGNSGAYVQLSNIFASYGEWGGSAEVRKLMRHKGIQKNPGCSCMLVVATTGTGFVLGSGTAIDLPGLCYTCAGTMMVAASASTLNQVFEKNNDAKMKRTMQRPLPSGRITIPHAVFWASSMGLVGTALLASKTNALAAGLAASNLILYAFVYTPLKQIHPVNTWVGAVVGAIPPLLGWAAASGQVSLNSMILPAALYFWQLPHFMALAYMCRNDYAAGGFRMLSFADASGKRTAAVALRNCIYLIPLGYLAYDWGVTSKWFCLESTLLTLAITATAFSFYRDRTIPKARKMFYASLLYLPVFMSGILFHRLTTDNDQHCTTDSKLDTTTKLAASFQENRNVDRRKNRGTQGRPPVAYASVAPFPFLPAPSYAPS